MTDKTDTPLTDGMAHRHWYYQQHDKPYPPDVEYVDAEFARSLERKLKAAQDRIAVLERDTDTAAPECGWAALCDYLRDQLAEARKDTERWIDKCAHAELTALQDVHDLTEGMAEANSRADSEMRWAKHYLDKWQWAETKLAEARKDSVSKADVARQLREWYDDDEIWEKCMEFLGWEDIARELGEGGDA